MKLRFLILVILTTLVSLLQGCKEVNTVEPVTDVNTNYHSQLNPKPVGEHEENIVMADETVAKEFDGLTWYELRILYGLSVPNMSYNTSIYEEIVIEPEPVEQLDKTGYLETMAIETPMEGDDGKYYILLKGEWYEFNEETGVRATVYNCGALNFREGPSTKNTILDCLYAKTTVYVFKAAHMSDNSTWYYVRQNDGTEGWQHSYYLNIHNSMKKKPSTVDILALMEDKKPGQTFVDSFTTEISCDTSGKLATIAYSELSDEYKETGYNVILNSKTFLWDGAGYTNKRYFVMNKGDVVSLIGKALMSNNDTWFKVKVTDENGKEFIGYIDTNIERGMSTLDIEELWQSVTNRTEIKPVAPTESTTTGNISAPVEPETSSDKSIITETGNAV